MNGIQASCAWWNLFESEYVPCEYCEDLTKSVLNITTYAEIRKIGHQDETTLERLQAIFSISRQYRAQMRQAESLNERERSIVAKEERLRLQENDIYLQSVDLDRKKVNLRQMEEKTISRTSRALQLIAVEQERLRSLIGALERGSRSIHAAAANRMKEQDLHITRDVSFQEVGEE